MTTEVGQQTEGGGTNTMSAEITISAIEANGTQQYITLDGQPEECPACHKGQKPHDLNLSFLSTEKKDNFHRLQRVYRCVFTECEAMFIAIYAYPLEDKALFVRSTPQRFVAKGWEESIKAVSPDFVEIYSQASEAESRELDKIAGPGYRKALEFLVKDWLIANNTDEAENIRNKLLGNCINEYINEGVIKDVASRASWLGNDETHYSRKWTEKDINDLKRLIELTASWINMLELSSHAVQDMPKPTKAKELKA